MKPIYFSSPQDFYDWLEENHETADEVYVGYFKKATEQAQPDLVPGG